MAIVVLLTPLAFALKIPVVVPISCALLNVTDFHGGGGMWNGCILYDGLYEKAASGMQGGSVKGMMGQIG